MKSAFWFEARAAGLLGCWLGLAACGGSIDSGREADPVSAGATVPAAGGGGAAAGAGVAGSSAGHGAGGNAGASSIVAGRGSAGSAAGKSGSSGGGAGAAAGAAAVGGSAGTAGRAGTGAAGGGGKGGSSGSGGAGGAGGAAGSSGAGGATFTEIYALMVDSCNGCHGPSAGGLKTNSQATAYTNLVNANAQSCSGQKRVVPGKPETSVLYLTINRTSSGSCDPPDMPRNAAKWPQANIDLVKNWIAAGAPNN